jgi:hypothetical protein
MQELRIYFQNAALSEDTHPSLKKAVVVDMARRDKPDRFNNFNEGWDILRFVSLVESLDATSPFPKRKDIVKQLIEYRTMRNEFAHPDHCGPGDGYDDDELFQFIRSTRKYVLDINHRDTDSPEAKQIGEKLEELQNCLFYEEENDVNLLVNQI